MLKNLIKYLVIIVAVAAVLGTIVYFLKKYRSNSAVEEDFFDSDLEDFQFDA